MANDDAKNDGSRGAAVEYLKKQRAEHEKRTGTALPDSRKIENWASEVGRRNDARDRERK